MKRRKINNIVKKAKNDIASSSTSHLTQSVVHSLLVGDGPGSSKALYIYARHFNRFRNFVMEFDLDMNHLEPLLYIYDTCNNMTRSAIHWWTLIASKYFKNYVNKDVQKIVSRLVWKSRKEPMLWMPQFFDPDSESVKSEFIQEMEEFYG